MNSKKEVATFVSNVIGPQGGVSIDIDRIHFGKKSSVWFVPLVADKSLDEEQLFSIVSVLQEQIEDLGVQHINVTV